MTKLFEDFKVWMESLKGMDIDKDANELESLIAHPQVDYVVKPYSIRFAFNNIAVINVNQIDGTYFFDYVLPWQYDVIFNIKSTDKDKVKLTVRVGGQKLNNLYDPILLLAAQYHEVRVQISFDKTNLPTGFIFGFDFESICYQHEHRKKLAATPWTVKDHCSYSNGLASVISFPITPKHDNAYNPLIPPEDTLLNKLQNEQYLHKWQQIFDSYMKENHKDSVKNDSKYKYLYDMLIHIPQLKIIHEESWREKLKDYNLAPGVIFAIKHGYDPDVNTYISKYIYKQDNESWNRIPSVLNIFRRCKTQGDQIAFWLLMLKDDLKNKCPNRFIINIANVMDLRDIIKEAICTTFQRVYINAKESRFMVELHENCLHENCEPDAGIHITKGFDDKYQVEYICWHLHDLDAPNKVSEKQWSSVVYKGNDKDHNKVVECIKNTRIKITDEYEKMKEEVGIWTRKNLLEGHIFDITTSTQNPIKTQITNQSSDINKTDIQKTNTQQYVKGEQQETSSIIHKNNFNKALCNLSRDPNDINGILELLDIGAEPYGNPVDDLTMSAFSTAIIHGNISAITLYLCKGYYNDPCHQELFRKHGTICKDERIRKLLCDHNQHAIKQFGWDDKPICEVSLAS